MYSMNRESHYYLWLKPAEPDLSRLRELIRRLSAIHGTPEFEPHVSLLARVRGALDEISDGIALLACRSESFSLPCRGVAFRDEYYRCLYLDLGRAPALTDLYNRARRCLVHDEEWKFEPHLSLMYGDLPRVRKQAIVAGLAGEWPKSIRAGSLVLCSAPGAPAEWRGVMEFALGDW